MLSLISRQVERISYLHHHHSSILRRRQTPSALHLPDSGLITHSLGPVATQQGAQELAF